MNIRQRQKRELGEHFVKTNFSISVCNLRQVLLALPNDGGRDERLMRYCCKGDEKCLKFFAGKPAEKRPISET
jgi:hypothetical protein